MAKKKLTEEQEKEIKILLANNEMLEKTKQEVKERGITQSLQQIERAQQEVIDHISAIDKNFADELKASNQQKKDTSKQADLFSTDMSIFSLLDENEQDNKELKNAQDKSQKVLTEELIESETPQAMVSENIIPDNSAFNNIDPTIQYDVIELPSNGQCYKSKLDRVPVAYLTAYDENIITSPNLYKDGLVIDYLLKNKIVNKEINIDELVSGDADAIILFLRATSYGPEFPIVVADPETNEQIETTIDLTTLKPRDFKLIGDENGYFDYTTPLRKDVIKFRYLTRKQEKQLRQVTELEGCGTKANMLEREREALQTALINDKYITDNETKAIKAALKSIEAWSKRLRLTDSSEYTKIMTNSLQLQVMAINGNYDRDYIRKYINTMPARDSMMLRKYINDNRPGINFDITVERPESLGGGSFQTFLNWDDSVFLNIADI